MLTTSPKYGLTVDEIAQVCVVRATTIYAAVFICSTCRRIKFSVSHDSGLTPKWLPAAEVIHRLHRGNIIGGN